MAGCALWGLGRVCSGVLSPCGGPGLVFSCGYPLCGLLVSCVVALVPQRRYPRSTLKIVCSLLFTNNPIVRLQTKVVKFEGWNFNSGNYLFTTDTK